MNVKIDKNISLPDEGGRGRALKYPWDQMKVGDSFETRVDRKKLASSAGQWVRRKGNGWKFASRKTKKGARIWRIA